MMIARRRGGGRLAGARAVLDGAIRIVAGGGLAALAWCLSGGKLSPAVARRLYTFERGRGMLDFAVGRQVQEYARAPVSEAAA